LKPLIQSSRAAKQLDDLPDDAREQVETGLSRYAMTGRSDVKVLQGRAGTVCGSAATG
jgi:hypothetical protein